MSRLNRLNYDINSEASIFSINYEEAAYVRVFIFAQTLQCAFVRCSESHNKPRHF